MNDFVRCYDDNGTGVWAKPLATDKLLKKLCKLTAHAFGAKKVEEESKVHWKQDRKKRMSNVIMGGPKCVCKAILKGTKGIVVLSGSAPHIDMIAPIPMICEEHKIPYIWVQNKSVLVEGGCGMSYKYCPCVYMIKRENLEEKWQTKFDEVAKKVKKKLSALQMENA